MIYSKCMIDFYPTHNHTWHVFAFKASFQHINKENHYVSSSNLISINTPPPFPQQKYPTRTKTNHQTNTPLKQKHGMGKIQKTPDPTISCRPYPPFKLRVDPARSAPHRLVDGKFLAMTCALGRERFRGRGKARKVGRWQDAKKHEWLMFVRYSFMESC